MITKNSTKYNRLALAVVGILCIYVTNAQSDYNYNYEGNDWKGVCATVSNQIR